jgi:hypothetical protein
MTTMDDREELRLERARVRYTIAQLREEQSELLRKQAATERRLSQKLRAKRNSRKRKRQG